MYLGDKKIQSQDGWKVILEDGNKFEFSDFFAKLLISEKKVDREEFLKNKNLACAYKVIQVFCDADLVTNEIVNIIWIANNILNDIRDAGLSHAFWENFPWKIPIRKLKTITDKKLNP